MAALITNPSAKSSTLYLWPCVFLLFFMTAAVSVVEGIPPGTHNVTRDGTPTIGKGKAATMTFESNLFSENASIIRVNKATDEHSSSKNTWASGLKNDVSVSSDGYTGFWKGVNETNYQTFYEDLSLAVDDFSTHNDCSFLLLKGFGAGKSAKVSKDYKISVFCYNRISKIQDLSQEELTTITAKFIEPDCEWKFFFKIGNHIPVPVEFEDIFFANLDKANREGMTFTYLLNAEELDAVNRRNKSYIKSKLSKLGYTNDLEEKLLLRFKKNHATQSHLPWEWDLNQWYSLGWSFFQFFMGFFYAASGFTEFFGFFRSGAHRRLRRGGLRGLTSFQKGFYYGTFVSICLSLYSCVPFIIDALTSLYSYLMV